MNPAASLLADVVLMKRAEGRLQGVASRNCEGCPAQFSLATRFTAIWIRFLHPSDFCQARLV